MKKQLLLGATASLLASTASAQVNQFVGPGPNGISLDFDTPFVASGPITSTSATFTGAGITSVNVIGTSWNAAGDVINAASNGSGQSLAVVNGALAIAGINDAIDNPGAGDGWEIVLANPATEFEALFVDQVNMNYDVELLMGATSLGSATFNYAGGFPNPPHYWDAGGAMFDTIRITSTTATGGYALDNFAFTGGPPPPAPANDDCGGAQVAVLGDNSFNVAGATPSAGMFSCGMGGNDVWFSYTVASNTPQLTFSTCGTGFDTIVEVYSGACGSLTSVACNDDSCGNESEVNIANPSMGATYLVRVGAVGSGAGGNLAVSEAPAANCVETLFASNNGGNVGGAVYFDLTVTANVVISGLSLNTGVASGTPVGLEVYTTPMTYQGNAGNPAAWTLAAADDGTSASSGVDIPTPITFLAPMNLAPGTYGIALIGNNALTGLQLSHSYTNGNGTNQNYASVDGVLSLSLGAADNTPFAGGAFTPRVWNGSFCHGLGTPGVNYCGPAVPNSTGNSATMSAGGTASVMANNLTLEANDLPNGAFGFFLTSMTQGFAPMPGGSSGNLCLGGSIGRFVGAGQIQNSGMTGSISLLTDNSMWPTPGGLVQVNAGETWNCQAWFRDAVGGMATSNFTDGLEITFTM